MSTINAQHIIENLESRYNPERDLIPGAPVVTWADNQLADVIGRLIDYINDLDRRIKDLEQSKQDAAPDLYAALENLVRQFAEDGQEPSSEDLQFMEAIRQSRTALAKARGEA